MCELITKEQIKRKIKENTSMYYKTKNKSAVLYNNLLLSKTALRNYQRLYWEHKELRDDINFMKLYGDLKYIYDLTKSNYLASCGKLKFYKKCIRDWNSELGRLNG